MAFVMISAHNAYVAWQPKKRYVFHYIAGFFFIFKVEQNNVLIGQTFEKGKSWSKTNCSLLLEKILLLIKKGREKEWKKGEKVRKQERKFSLILLFVNSTFIIFPLFSSGQSISPGQCFLNVLSPYQKLGLKI